MLHRQDKRTTRMGSIVKAKHTLFRLWGRDDSVQNKPCAARTVCGSESCEKITALNTDKLMVPTRSHRACRSKSVSSHSRSFHPAWATRALSLLLTFTLAIGGFPPVDAWADEIVDFPDVADVLAAQGGQASGASGQAAGVATGEQPAGTGGAASGSQGSASEAPASSEPGASAPESQGAGASGPDSQELGAQADGAGETETDGGEEALALEASDDDDDASLPPDTLLEKLSVETEYHNGDGVGKTSATIHFDKQGIPSEGVNLIFLMDISKKGKDSYKQFRRALIDGFDYYLNGYEGESTVRLVYYRESIKADSGFFMHDALKSERVSDLEEACEGIGEGVANEEMLLTYATQCVQEAKENPTTANKRNVVVWAPGEEMTFRWLEQDVEPVEAAATRLKEELGDEGVLMAFQMADHADPLLEAVCTTKANAPGGEKVPAVFTEESPTAYRAQIADAAEKLLHDHYHNIDFTLSLTPDQTLVKHITSAQTRIPVTSDASVTVAEDGQSVAVHIGSLCRQSPVGFDLEVELDTTIFDNQVVFQGDTLVFPHAAVWMGPFDDTALEGLSLALPSVELDRTPVTLTYLTPEGALDPARPAHQYMAGDRVTIDAGEGVAPDGSTFGGWYDDARHLHYPGNQLILMPDHNLTLTPSVGHVEVQLDLDWEKRDGPIPGSRIHPAVELGDSANRNAGINRLFEGNLDYPVTQDPNAKVRLINIHMYRAQVSWLPLAHNKGQFTPVAVSDVPNAVCAQKIGKTEDDEVIAILKRNGDKYDLDIVAPGGVILQNTSNHEPDLFKWLNVDGNVTLENVDIRELIDDFSYIGLGEERVTEIGVCLNSLFAYARLGGTLDLSGVDMFDVASTTHMFGHVKAEALLLPKGRHPHLKTTSDMFESAQFNAWPNLDGFDTSKACDMSYMFAHSNVTSPDTIRGLSTTSAVTLVSMFSSCDDLQGFDSIAFDTANVTNMGSMFYGAFDYKVDKIVVDMSEWDTSHVTTMANMFNEAASSSGRDLVVLFGDTSNVTNMYAMFCETSRTLTALGLDTQSVTDARSMFEKCVPTRETVSEIERFSMGNAKYISDMFWGVSVWGENDTESTLDLSAWDTHSIEGAANDSDAYKSAGGFLAKSNFTHITLGRFFDNNPNTNVSMQSFVGGCPRLKEVDAQNWQTGCVRVMANLFGGLNNVETLDVGGWDTSHVTTMEKMFADYGLRWEGEGAHTILGLETWDTSSVTTMEKMFSLSLFEDISGIASWDTGKVKSFSEMLYRSMDKGSTVEELDLSGWDLTSATSMFHFIASNRVAPTSLKLGNADHPSVNLTGVTQMFASCGALTSLEMDGLDTSKVTDTEYMFSYCRKLTDLDIHQLELQNVKNMECMFEYDPVWAYDFKDWDTSHVTDMAYMFRGANFGDGGTLKDLDTSNVTSVHAMFQDAWGTHLDLSGWNLEHASGYKYMFNNLAANAPGESPHLPVESVDLHDWKLPAKTWESEPEPPRHVIMDRMFEEAAIKKLNLNGWDTSAVTCMQYMFSDYNEGVSAAALEGFEFDIAHFDMSSLYYAAYGNQSYNANRMLQDAYLPMDTLDVSTWNVENTTTLDAIFSGAHGFTTLDVSGWDTSHTKVLSSGERVPVTESMDRLFYECGAENLKLGENFYLALDDADSFLDGSSISNIEGSFHLHESYNVESMGRVFSGIEHLSEVPLSFAPGKTTVEFPHLHSMSYMFTSSPSLETMELKGWVTPNLTQMYDVFDLYSKWGPESSLKTITLDLRGIRADIPAGFTLSDNLFRGIPADCVLITSEDRSANNAAAMAFIREKFEARTASLLAAEEGAPELGDEGDDAWKAVEPEPESDSREADILENEGYVPAENKQDVAEPAATKLDEPEPEPVFVPNPGLQSRNSANLAQASYALGLNTPFDSAVVSAQAANAQNVSLPSVTAPTFASSAVASEPTRTAYPVSAPTAPASVQATYPTSEQTGDALSPNILDSFVAALDDVLPPLPEHENMWVHPPRVEENDHVSYKVTVKFAGGPGAKSGRIHVEFPIPEDISPQDDPQMGEGEWQIGVTPISTVGDNYGFKGGYFVNPPEVVDKVIDGEMRHVFQADFDGLYANTQFTISIKGKLDAKSGSDFNDEGYAFWDGTAFAGDQFSSQASRTIRLWTSRNEDDPAPDTTPHRLEYRYVGEVPAGITLPQPELHEAGEVVTPFEVEEQEGYSFAGWVRSDTGETVSGSFPMPDSDLVLEGKWTKTSRKYLKVVLEYAGEVPEDALPCPGTPIENRNAWTNQVEIEQQFQIPNPDFFRMGHYRLSAFTPVANSANIESDLVPALTIGNADIPLTWDEEEGLYHSADGNYSIPASGVLDTHQFADCSDQTVVVRLVAHWLADTGTIRFNPNGGSGEMAPLENVPWDSADNLPACAFTPPQQGQSIMGWALVPNGTKVRDEMDKIYYSDNSKPALLQHDGDDVTLYAIWGMSDYQVVYRLNHVQKDRPGEDTETITAGSSFEVRLTCDPGYEFSEEVSALGDGVVVEDIVPGKEVRVSADMVKSDILITANAHPEEPAEVVLTAKKTVDGGVPEPGETFTFDLKDASGSVVQTKTNVGGEVAFDALFFEEAGEYTYQISERDETADALANNGILYDYDHSVYEVKVAVTETGPGRFEAQVTYSKDETPSAEALFENKLKIIPPMGVPVRVAHSSVLLVLSAACVLGAVVLRQRRRRGAHQ